MPNDFPGYSTDGNHINDIENAISEQIAYERLLPYIQKYEFETLLFADTSAFELLTDDKQLAEIEAITNQYPNIEDINGGAQTAPSKRLLKIFDYNKTVNSSIIMDYITIETIMSKSQRFEAWINKLKEIINR